MVTRRRKEELQQLTVYGYIHEQIKDIPDDITYLCYQFYLRVFDEWDIDKCNKGLIIDAETGIIQIKYNNNNKRNFLNAFGSIIVKKGQVETWKFKPKTAPTNDRLPLPIGVGIVESNKASKDMELAFFFGHNAAGIGYFGHNGYVYGKDGAVNLSTDNPLGLRWKFPEIITLKLDMKSKPELKMRQFGTLWLTKGDNDKETVICNEVDLNKEYRVAVAFAVTENVMRGHDPIEMQLLQD